MFEAKVERFVSSPHGMWAFKGLVSAIVVLGIMLAFAVSAGAQETFEGGSDPQVLETVRARALQNPAPDGCLIVGGWEDGSIVAACQTWVAGTGEWEGYTIVETTWITDGPDIDDTWQAYDGPIAKGWWWRVDHNCSVLDERYICEYVPEEG